jgi:hypothetical protein
MRGVEWSLLANTERPPCECRFRFCCFERLAVILQVQTHCIYHSWNYDVCIVFFFLGL